mmetsp:Transcript_84613/g.137154  ORF Transcript_84613/g.137154 Transcript_84613/m.137154 type:complete len:223 (-) Transcript_84613:3984-4652(-)
MSEVSKSGVRTRFILYSLSSCCMKLSNKHWPSKPTPVSIAESKHEANSTSDSSAKFISRSAAISITLARCRTCPDFTNGSKSDSLSFPMILHIASRLSDKWLPSVSKVSDDTACTRPNKCSARIIARPRSHEVTILLQNTPSTCRIGHFPSAMRRDLPRAQSMSPTESALKSARTSTIFCEFEVSKACRSTSSSSWLRGNQAPSIVDGPPPLNRVPSPLASA